MPSSRDLPPDRLPVGQLLVQLLREFRRELFAPASEAGYPDIRASHLQIFGNLDVAGIRLTTLAERAQLSLAAASELVNELQELGYLERRADPTDRRAKLIVPTARGRQALRDARDQVAEIEQRWSALVGPDRFADGCRTLQDLIDALDGPGTEVTTPPEPDPKDAGDAPGG
jgi:DNA-binding MarR family transcriptional regulator